MGTKKVMALPTEPRSARACGHAVDESLASETAQTAYQIDRAAESVNTGLRRPEIREQHSTVLRSIDHHDFASRYLLTCEALSTTREKYNVLKCDHARTPE